MVTPGLVATLMVTLLFCLAFLGGRTLDRLGRRRHRTVISLAGGAAVAYVFVDLSPELQDAALGFREATSSIELYGLDRAIELTTMTGFLLFYGIDELIARSPDEQSAGHPEVRFRLDVRFLSHLAAFSAYAWLVTYLMVRSREVTPDDLVFYAAAMALHFLAVAHALQEQHGIGYERIGAPMLIACSLAGWICGWVLSLQATAVALLLGLVAGGVIANTLISELPREREGRFLPFCAGAAAYTGLLLLAR